MRILQIIDSLEAGGAERMAVNYAVSLRRSAAFSGIAVTRKEGSLKSALPDDVPYCFLDRKSTFDWKAIAELRKFCVENKVQWLHAHSSSWFLAVCVKVLLPSLRIIWHDHYGLSEFTKDRKAGALKWGSLFFSGIVSVNENLRKWSLTTLFCRNVMYLPNFSISDPNQKKETVLKGESGKRILCLANLRPQKDHFMLIDVARRISFKDWTFHLAGKDFEDDYSRSVNKKITEYNLQDKIFIYGSRNDVQNVISQCDICILTSASEGLPVALLEYGFHSKPVVVTNVGEIPAVVKDGQNGFSCESGDAEKFASLVGELIADESLRQQMGKSLFETVNSGYSENAVLQNYMNWIKSL